MRSKAINFIKEHGARNVCFLGEADAPLPFPDFNFGLTAVDENRFTMIFDVNVESISDMVDQKLELIPWYKHFSAIRTYRSDFDSLLTDGVYKALVRQNQIMTSGRIALLKDVPMYFCWRGFKAEKFFGFTYVPSHADSVHSLFALEKVTSKHVYLKSVIFDLAIVKMTLAEFSRNIAEGRMDYYMEYSMGSPAAVA
jgi:hypothetical protein